MNAQDQVIDLSLSEFESLAFMALRGAGYPWGLAADGALAARRLAQAGQPATTTVLGLVDQLDEVVVADVAPDPASRWRSPSGVLCPICVGAALNDFSPSEEVIELVLADDGLVEPTLAAALNGRGVQPDAGTCSRVSASTADVERLKGYAQRTYAPATEASRQAGAGAGTTDND